jgi:hypothetical protein
MVITSPPLAVASMGIPFAKSQPSRMTKDVKLTPTNGILFV